MPHVVHTAEGWQVGATGDVHASLRDALDAALASVATHEKPAYFRDEDGAEIGAWRWLPAVAEEDAPLGGVRIDATTIEEMAASLNSSTRAIPIDGGTDDSPAHGTMSDPGTRANGRGHWLVTVANADSRAEGYLWAELLPDVARDVDIGRLGEGSVHIRFGRKDGDAARDVEYASHALLNDPGVVTLAPANSVRSGGAESAWRSVPMAGRAMPGGKRSQTRAAGRRGESMKTTLRAKLTGAVAKFADAKRGPALDKLTEIAAALGVDLDAELESSEWDSPVIAAIQVIKNAAIEEKVLDGLAPAPASGETAESARAAVAIRSAITEALGLAEDADEAAIVDAIKALKAKAEAPEEGGGETAEAARRAAKIEQRAKDLAAEVARLSAELEPLKASEAKRAREAEVDSMLAGRVATAKHRADILEHAELFGLEAARGYAKALALPPAGSPIPRGAARSRQAPEAQGAAASDEEIVRQAREMLPALRAQHPDEPGHVLLSRAMRAVRAGQR